MYNRRPTTAGSGPRPRDASFHRPTPGETMGLLTGPASITRLIAAAPAEAPDFEAQGDVVFVAFNRGAESAEVTLPAAAEGTHWVRAIDTAQPDPGAYCEIASHSIKADGESVVVLVLKPHESSA